MTERRRGTCHCGAIEFEVELENGLTGLLRCGCSICLRKGAVMCGVPLANLRLLRGRNQLKLYQWNTMTARHYFSAFAAFIRIISAAAIRKSMPST